jgi:hypothetical protein
VKILLDRLIQLQAPLDVQVRCICIMFTRIVDLENLNGLLHKYSMELRSEVYHRLGILNVWNPIEIGQNN